MSYETVLYDIGSQLQIVQADGRRLMFQRGALGQLCSSPSPQDGQVRIEQDARGQRSYHWRWPDGRTLTFGGGSGGGHPLQTITAPTGEQLTFTYSPQRDLVQVRDPQGRSLHFIYARNGRLQAIDTPLGRLRYTKDRQGRLVLVDWQDSTQAAPHRSRRYHYEDRHNGGHANALTGISLRTLDPQTNQPTEQRLPVGSDGLPSSE